MFNSERSEKSHNGTADGDFDFKDELEETFFRGLKEGFLREQRRMREEVRKKKEEEARDTKMEKMELVMEDQRKKIEELQKKLEVEGARIINEFNNKMKMERSSWEEKMEEMRIKVEAVEKKRADEEEKRRVEVESEKEKREAELKKRRLNSSSRKKNETSQRGEFDDLVSALRSGEVFDDKGKYQKRNRTRRPTVELNDRERPHSKVTVHT